MLKLSKVILVLGLASILTPACASAHTPHHHDPYSEYWEEYHVVYPSSQFIIVIDNVRHSHNGKHVHSHLHYGKYHEHKKRTRFKKIYKKHFKKKVKKGKIRTKKKVYHHHH